MRKIKTLGLTLVAILALTAVAASAASAHEVTAGAYEANVSGEQTNTNTLSNGVREVSCANATLTGALTAASPSLTITPVYTNCTGNAGTTATIDMNGCTYILVPTAASGIANNASVTVNCTGTNEINVTIWATGKAHTEAKLCTLGVPHQIVLGKYTNTANGLSLVFAANTLVVNRLGGTALNCGAATTSAGTYNGALAASAKHIGVATSLDAI
jgi:hypothetical protein